jgi:DNA-binding response OmpR family regulator
VRALLRRASIAAPQSGAQSVLRRGHITIDSERRSAYKDGVPVELTMKEFDLIEFLMKNPGRVYSRENLLNLVWGYDYQGDTRTVDVHVRRLREKLEKNPAQPEFIVTKWGVGYYFAD